MFEANKLNYVPLLRKQVELYISNRSVFIKTLLPAKPVLLAGETCAASLTHTNNTIYIDVIVA